MLMANDSLFLVCRGCAAMRKIFKYYGHADDTEYVSGSELAKFLSEHLYCTGYGDGVHLPEQGFEMVTEHVLMRRESDAPPAEDDE